MSKPKLKPLDEVKFQDVESSNIWGVGFDPEEKVLYVKFHNGGAYAYFDVPEAKYQAMLAAESVGKYLNASIKAGHAFEKLA